MHVLLPEHSVDKVTDELGISLSDMTCVERLCEDATFNLSKLISTARTFQRVEHCPELNLRHLQEASELLNMPLSPSITESDLIRMNTHETIFYKDVSEVDLYDLTHGATTECTAPPLNLEVTLTSENSGSRDSSSLLSPTAHRYLVTMCSQLTSKNNDLLEEALTEMRASKRISIILPYLLQFIDLRLRDNVLLSGNTIQLLLAYKNILQNNEIYLDPFIPNLLDECYSMCCDWTDSRESAVNTIGVIEHSSDVTAYIILKFEDRNTRYYEKYTRFCVETVESDESSLSALGSLTLLSKLGPRCVQEKMLPLIFGIYNTVFTDVENVIVDHTMIHIKRVLKLTLLSVYSAIYKNIHISKLNELVGCYNSNHSPYQLQSKSDPQSDTSADTQGLLAPPSTEPMVTDSEHTDETDRDGSTPVLTYDTMFERLGESCSMVVPTWPHLAKHPSLLARKQSKEITKKLRETFVMFGTLKGKMLPAERKIFLRKKTDKQIRSSQIYNLYNNFAPLQYFL